MPSKERLRALGSTFNQITALALALAVKKSLMEGRNRPSQEQRVGKAVGATLRHPSACSVPAMALSAPKAQSPQGGTEGGQSAKESLNPGPPHLAALWPRASN